MLLQTQLLLTFSLLQPVVIFAEKVELLDYCRLHHRNTPCMYSCQRSSRCGNTNTSYSELSAHLRQVVIKLHNQIRGGVYSKNDTLELKAPKKLHFIPLSYDKECEFIAGCYAKQCRNHPDQMRIALDGTRLGQNRFVLSAKLEALAGYSPQERAEKLISTGIYTWISPGRSLTNQWYKFLHESYVPQIYPYRQAPFTQMIWENSRYVGCAIMQSARDSKWEMYELICNYKPAGNIRGEPVYRLDNKEYPTCTNPGRKEPEYTMTTNICLEYFRSFDEDTYKPPIDLNNAHMIRHYYITEFVCFCFIIFKALTLTPC